MKKITLFFFLLFSVVLRAQVGVNTTTPDPSSMLDITATNKGVLVPRVSLANVTTTMLDGTNTAATGLLIWNTNAATIGGNGAGFYYFNGTQWMPITQTITGNTLDQSYDQGGAGAGKNIDATDGAVRINGDDGFLVTGTHGSGNTIDTEITGTGTRMFFNPRKAAFRAGYVSGNNWDDLLIGNYSAAFGRELIASGSESFSVGYFCRANGDRSFASGSSNEANGFASSSFGNFNRSDGWASSSFGDITRAEGRASSAFGQTNTASSYGEMVIGIGATTYFPSTNGTTQFRSANASDRLFVIGNAIDLNNNNSVDTSERRDALVMLKNGNTGLGSSTPEERLHVVGNIRMVDGNQAAGRVLKSDSNGTASWQDEVTIDHDWYEVGGTNPPNAITDEIYTQGKVIIGKNNSSINTMVDIENSDRTSALNLLTINDSGSLPVTYSIQNTINATNSSAIGNTNNIEVNHTGIGNNSGLINNLTGNMASGAAIGVSTRFDTTGGNNQIAVYNTFASTSATGNVILGLRNWFQSGSNYTGPLEGISNDFNNNNNGNHTAVKNDFTGTGSGIKYGTKNTFSGNGNGSFYGIHTDITNIGAGNKYGEYISIRNTASGTHYGIYSSVPKADSFAGYFLGRLSVGTTTTNNYIFPLSRGTNGQIMQTDGTGIINWINPSTINTDNQTIDEFSLTGTTLNLSLSNDGVATQTVNLNSLANDWKLTGNTGTTPTTNFIGTTDNQDLSIRTNNTEKVRITAKGQIETTQLQSVWIGNSAGEVATGTRNVFVGHSSGISTTIGSDNTAIGGLTLNTNTEGFDNTAIGLASLYSLSSGDGNTAIGEQTLENFTTGSYNTFVGHLAGENYTSGLRNTVMGFQAGQNASGDGNVFIGSNAGRNSTAGNRLFIENNGADENNALIYGEFDNDILRTNSEFQVRQNSSGTLSHVLLREEGANDGARIKFTNAAEADNEWVLYGRADNTVADSRFHIYHNGTGDIVRITGGGLVGIMRTPTTNALEVNGNASKTVAGGFLANSDSRLKKDISTISPNDALEKILKLRGVTYHWNDDKTGTVRPENLQIGFIAQEIAEIFPEKVTEDNLGFLQTAYGDYDPIVFQAIKALNDKIEKLENENSALKSALEKVNALEAKLEQMNIE